MNPTSIAHPLYTTRQIRHAEQAASQQTPPPALMTRAGLAAATLARTLLPTSGLPVLVLAGPGNNGGDALELAALLSADGQQVSVVHCMPTGSQSPERAVALQRAQACSDIRWLTPDAHPALPCALVVDGLFGIGLTRALPAELAALVRTVNSLQVPVLALDVPSGLNADTGVAAEPTVQATHTLTFIGDKVGLHTGDGRDFAGTVHCASLDIAPALLPASGIALNGPAQFDGIYQPRLHNSNKGTHGTVQLIGGSAGMQGALVLAARAALFGGAGKVLAGFVEQPLPVDSQHPEIMCRQAAALLAAPLTDAVTAIGTGLGQSAAAFDLLSKALLASAALVIDADALTLLAQQPALAALCNGRDAHSTLLTPHPLEAARLLGCDVAKVQADRLDAARSLARRFQSVVILKGSGSVIARPDGQVVINSTGNAGLASGGTGDVLAGLCAALVAQHRDVWQAALAAAWLHGKAADELVSNGVGPVGLTAGELLPVIRRLINVGP